jgi:predicted small metal-binding protein
MIPGCKFVARGESVEEVLARVAEHARTKHLLRSVSPQLIDHMRTIIREEKAVAAKA